MKSSGYLKYLGLTVLIVVLSAVNVLGQQTISGTVANAETGEPLIGVNILVKGTTSGTTTDDKGHYSLSVSSLQDTLVFSFVGYKAQIVPISGRTTIDIALKPQALVGKELVVVGYGTQKKKNITGAISSIDAKDLKKTTSPSIADALAGRVAGVSIQTSGDPGAAPMIKIRGPNSFGSNQPLYVIDGVPVGGIQDFNLNDVASIQILKGVAAAAIYGSRAANGVVIITTKNGKAGEVKVHYEGYYGVQHIVQRYDMIGTKEYGMLIREEIKNAHAQGLSQNVTIPPAVDQSSSYYISPNEINTNWQDATFKPAAIQSHNVSISGGSQNSTFSVTGSYFNQGSTVEAGPKYKRYSGRINLTQTFGNFEVHESLYYSHSDKVNLTGLHLTAGVLDIVKAIPIMPVRDSSRVGGYGGTRSNIERAIVLNVIGANNLLESTTKVNRFLGSASAQYNFMENLYYKIQYSYDQSTVDLYNFVPVYDLGFFYQNTIAKLDRGQNQYNTQILQNTLHYSKDIGGHHFTVMLGYTQQVNTFNNFGGHSEGYTKPYYKVLNAGLENKTSAGYKTRSTMRSYFGRITYNYKGTYLLQGVLRRDGSSRFAPSNRYGTFPSVSVGWMISNEPFFEGISFINSLKLRAGYGVLGSQDIAPYLYTAEINPYANYNFGNSVVKGATQISLVDPDIKWETTISRDIGIDMTLFNNKLSITADYFNNKTKDILVAVPIPLTTGSTTSPVVNGATIRNKGFEFTAEYSNTAGSFHYSLHGNFSILHNEVLSLGAGDKPIFGDGSKTAVGHSIGAVFGYVADGLFQNKSEINTVPPDEPGYDPDKWAYQEAFTAPGDIRFKDLNGDGIITSADRTFLGSAIPKFKYGFSANLRYKQWDFSFFFMGVYGNKIVNRVRQSVSNMIGYNNATEYVFNNHWTPENRSTNVPRAVFGDPNNNARMSQRWVEDGSYLRLKNIQIGYSLPQKFLAEAGISNLRIYLQGQNVFTLTGYSGYTPVISSSNTAIDGPVGGGNDGLFSRGVDVGSYPQPRTISLGISLRF